MALDPTTYIVASDLQQYIVDKDTGGPLSGGIIKFYEDESRTTPKDVFILSGTPPDYSYTNIGSEIELSAVGTVQYNGADTVVYYKPFNADGDIQRYYVTVESSQNVPQFTRAAWPNFVESNAVAGGTNNFIINGQFLNNIVQTAKPINSTNTVLAPSGQEQLYSYGAFFELEKDVANGTNDQVTFNRFNPGDTSVESNPLFYLNYEVTAVTGGSETFKSLIVDIKDVRSFQGQAITISIAAKSSSLSTITCSVIQSFGTGGSPSADVTTLFGSASLTASWQKYEFTGIVPSVSGKTLGNNLNDNLGIAIGLPLNATCSIDLTNLQLNIGTASLPYPFLTRDFIWMALGKPKTGDMRFLGNSGTSANIYNLGWIAVDGSTLGSPTSGATHATQDVFLLYCYYWNNTSNTDCPVSTGRGATAIADFNANKTLTMPTSAGHAIGIFGNNGVNNRRLGEAAGSDSSTALLAHTHTITDPGHVHAFSANVWVSAGGNGEFNATPGEPFNTITSTNSAVTGISINSAGSGASYSIVQATTYFNAYVKL